MRTCLQSMYIPGLKGNKAVQKVVQKSKFYGEVTNGKLSLDRQALFLAYIQSLPEGTRLEITVEKESQDKTAEQLAYYFSCVVQPLADYLGYTKVEMDGVICKYLLTENLGTKKEYVKSKSDLNRADLAKFIDEAIMLAAQHGVVVLPPNKMWKSLK